VLAWAAGSIALILLVVAVAIFLVLRTNSGHQYVLNKVQKSVSESLGSRVQARDFHLTFSGISPAVDLYNVAIAGAAPYPTPPLVTVDHLSASVQITSLLGRTWYLKDIRVDHPVVRVFVDAHGNSNLPKPKSDSSSQSKTDVFDLGVRHAQLSNGEVYYNNQKSVLNADLHDLTFQAAFDTSKESYSGSLSYRNGHLQMGAYNPMPHDFQASFNAKRQAFTLQHAVLSSGRSQFTVDATVEDYANPRIRATYDASLDTGEFRRITKNPTLPLGVIRAAGNLSYVPRPNVPMLAAVVLNGDLSSGSLRVNTQSFRGNISNIGARYGVQNGNLSVRDLHANLLGGSLTGTLDIRGVAGNAPQSHLRAALRGVSLAELKGLMASPSLKQVGLSGGGNATADATWGKTFDNLVARTDAMLNARVAPSNGAAGVPLTGSIHARYAAPAKQITLTQSYLRMPQTSLTLEGTVSDRSALQVRLQSQDLHELETVANIFQPPTAGQQPLDLHGQASFNGSVRGSTSAPQIAGQLNAQNLKVRNTAWRVLRTDVRLSPSQASLQNGLLQPADRGRITFNLTAGLHKWSFTDTSPVQLALNASNINAGELAKAAGTTTPVSGTLAANVAVHGSESNPIGNGQVTLTNAKVSGEAIQSLSVKFDGSGDSVRTNVALHMPAGTAEGVATIFPKKKEFQANLQAHGVRLDQLQTVKTRNMKITGVLDVDASGQGSFDNPQLSAH